MDLCAPVVADEQSFEVVKPGEGAFDDPAGATEPGAVLGLAAGDLGGDPEAAQQTSVLVVVVAAVGGDPFRPTARPADQPSHGRYALEEGEQLGDVIAVAACERPGKRDSGGVYQEVVLGAGSGSINRARARLGAPFFACT